MFSKGLAIPPRSLVALIVGITVVPLATLLWLGWRLLEQDRILEAQQVRQRVERAADLTVAALQRALSSDEQRLAAGSEQWPEGTVAVTFGNRFVEATPRKRVAWLPVVKLLREAPSSAFAQGEDLESRQRDHKAAIKVFRELAKSSDAAIRAGALLRLAQPKTAPEAKTASRTRPQAGSKDGGWVYTDPEAGSRNGNPGWKPQRGSDPRPMMAIQYATRSTSSSGRCDFGDHTNGLCVRIRDYL